MPRHDPRTRELAPRRGPRPTRARGRAQAGFSLAEILITVTVFLIMVGVAGTIFVSMYGGIKADSAWESLMSELRTARQNAVDQRRSVEVTFTAPNEIQFEQVQLSGALVAEPLWTLPDNFSFTTFAGQPDTPDAFGNSSAVDFTDSTGASAGSVLIFRSDGSIVDTAGNLVNGTLFIGKTGDPGTSRAITVMGATGIFHGYRYDVASNTFQ